MEYASSWIPTVNNSMISETAYSASRDITFARVFKFVCFRMSTASFLTIFQEDALCVNHFTTIISRLNSVFHFLPTAKALISRGDVINVWITIT